MEGRYGTIHYIQRVKPGSPIVSFPIDDEEVTVGRNSTCSIRLYYPEICPVHCRIFMNEEKKAFLAVHGLTGAIVDDCHVYPSHSDTKSSPTIIPLINNAEFEIHDKRFKFTYPPKEKRAALLATPSHPSNAPRKAIRLSMIQSALVFSPRPSPSPQENLRVLKSPLKPFRSPSKLSRLQQQESSDEDEADEDQEVVLVEGNHPRVFEEGKDLVITEDVLVQPEPHEISQKTIPEPPLQPPKTPRNRPFPRPSLHRAVLIRSAQRAVIRHEMEKEERAEEEEVAGAIVDDDDNFLEDVEEESSPFVEDVEMELDMGEGSHDEDQTQGVLGSWRKSLGSMWPFRASASPERDVPQDITDEENDEEDTGEKENSDEEKSEPVPSSSPPLQDDDQPPPAAEDYNRNRLSLGGAIRVKKEEPKWRVSEIDLPPLEVRTNPPQNEVKKENLSDEQREAIRERRRSALLRTPDMFFGGTPGTRKARPSIPAALPASPTKLAMDRLAEEDEDAEPSSNSTPVRRLFGNANTPNLPKKSKEQVLNVDDSEELDTKVLLERMKETVEGLKRRKSMASPTKLVPPSPTKEAYNLPPITAHKVTPLDPPPTSSDLSEPMDIDQVPNPKGESLDRLPDNLQAEEKENIAYTPIYPPLDSVRSPSTPKIQDLQKLFAEPQPPPDTPIFEGVGEMFRTPGGLWLEASGSIEAKEVEMDSEPQMEDNMAEMEIEVQTEDKLELEEDNAEKLSQSTSEGPATSPIDTPSLEDHNPVPSPQDLSCNDEDTKEAPPKPKARLPRANKSYTDPSDAAKGTSFPPSKTVTRVKAKGKACVESTEEKPAIRTTRRTRTTTTSSEEAGHAGNSTTKPPARQTKQNPSVPVAEPPATRTRSRKHVEPIAKVKEEADDPLDTLTKKPLVRKAAAAARPKSRAGVVKEEPTTLTLDTPAEGTKPRATRPRTKTSTKEPPPPEASIPKQGEGLTDKPTIKKPITRAKKAASGTAEREVETEPELRTTAKRVTRTRTKTTT